MKKRGRPIKPDGKKIQFKFRMDVDEWDKLNTICNETGMSKSDFFAKSIEYTI